MTIQTAEALLARLGQAARIDGDRLAVTDEAALRGELMDELAFEAVFNADPAMRDACRWVIWSASQALGCPSASIHELYLARGRGEFDATGFTVPAINVRASTYLTARQAFAAAIERDAGAVVFEIAKSEMAYTDQRPAEYTAVILAAALRSGWQGPVFLQGDHFQFNATKWRDDPDAEMTGLKDLTREAIAAGFLNIDIDSSTLVDLSRPGVAAQQAVNAANTVELTLLIRDLQPDGVVIGVGGEIGEVGKSNSTEEELRAYLDGYYSLDPRLAALQASARSASRPEPAMAASRCPTGRSPRSASTSTRCGGCPRSRATSTAWPAACSTAPAPCRTRRSITSRPTARRRSTWPPASRTSCTTSPACRRTRAPR